jgi:uncharacterized protein (TIGR03435 family)
VCYFYNMAARHLASSALAVIVAVLAPRPAVHAGAQATDNSSFEVASVKPNTGDGPTESSTQPGGRVTMINVPLRFLVRTAYQVQDEQIVDAPNWIGVEHFDIIAKAPGDIPRPIPGDAGPLPSMMRSLLSDRFKLVVHRETRESPAYELSLARRDGTLGPQLHPSTVDCAAIAAARGRSGAPPAGPGSDRPQCGIRAAGGQMMAGGIPLSQLATLLSSMVQRVVIDKTGLTGNFDFELKWTPDRAPQGPGPGALPPGNPDSPSIFTALSEQLGLKLNSTKQQVDVLVIDHVERPAPD